MHIVIIFYNIGGYHAARLRATAEACQKRDWSLTAIQVTDCAQEHPWGNLEQEITFPVKTLLPIATTPSSIDSTFSSKTAAHLLPETLDLLHPDVVAIPGWGFPIARTALSWCRQHHVKTVLMSESKWNDEKRVWWKELIKSYCYVKNYDAALVGGLAHQDYLIQLGFPQHRIFLGYDIVDNHYFAQGSAMARQDPVAARQRQISLPLKSYFLAVTRLIPRKNIVRLIHAFATYKRKVENDEAWDLVICGSGEEEAKIRHLIHHYQLDNCVHLPGFISYKDVVDWYGLATALIHPALTEQWGLVVNEACAASLPILASNTIGASELVHEGLNGWLFDPTCQEAIVQSMLQMHSLDPEARQKMGNISCEIISEYSPSRFADGLINGI